MQGTATGKSRKDVDALSGADLFEIESDEGKVEPQIGVAKEVFDLTGFRAAVKWSVGAPESRRLAVPQMLPQPPAERDLRQPSQLLSHETERMGGQRTDDGLEGRIPTEM